MRERRFTAPAVRALWPIANTIARRVTQGDQKLTQGISMALSYCLHDVLVYGTTEDLEPLLRLITARADQQDSETGATLLLRTERVA